MKKIQNKKGFTLIELLVVITIIGILATGWVTMYSEQLKWARDSTRITSVQSIQSAAEQYYQDNAEYPTLASANIVTKIWQYISSTWWIADPQWAKTVCFNTAGTSANSVCWMFFSTWNDANGNPLWSYKVSTSLEKKWNVTWSWRATIDWWNMKGYIEIFNWGGSWSILPIWTKIN